MPATPLKFGIAFTQAAPLKRVAEWWKAADVSSLDVLGIPDSPALLRELYVSMSVAAMTTSRIGLMSWVTNPVTRHPSVTAAAVMALNELAPGRISLGIATGDSALWATGQKAATVDYLRAYIRAVKAMMRGEAVQWQGATYQPRWANWEAAEVPIYVACSGPRVLGMAAQEADGVIVTMGFAPEDIRSVHDTIARASAEVGRDPAKLDLWSNALIMFAPSRREALEYTMGWTTQWLVEGSTKGKGIPEAIIPKLQELHRDIHDLDAVYKTPDRGRVMVERAKSLGVYDWIMEHSPQLFGTADEIAERLEHYAGLGLRNWFVLQSRRGTFVGGSDDDKYESVRQLAELRARFG